MSKWQFGYNIEAERKEEIIERGTDPTLVLMAMRAAFPQHNPYAAPWLRLNWQGQQGACQGHALAHMAQVICNQAYSVQRTFSRACGYYEAQRHDRITGDKGSTLSGGRKVASEDGLCLEQDWPYPDRYNPTRPQGFDQLPRIVIPSSKPIEDAELIYDLLEAGAAIQTGVNWNASFDVPVSDRHSTASGGGHSTLLYGLNQSNGNIVHHNSWSGWQQNGRNEWTLNFLKQILARDRWAVFVAYQATEVRVDDGIIPEVEPFEVI